MPASRIHLLAAILGCASIAVAQPAKRADELLKRMTLEEKTGQLTQLGGLPLIPDTVKLEDRIRRGHAGSILWLTDPAAINRLQNIAMEESRLRIPILFGLDVIHGFRTIFPIPLAMAASWDPSLVEQAQAVAAREARAAGIHWTFAPMLDITRDPRWGRIMEGPGEDPYLGSAMARAQVRGFQGPELGGPDRVLACAKHFAAYGAADGGRDYDSAYVPDALLWNVYLKPFQAALQAGVGTFMSAYMDLNDVPATAHRFLLQDVLRRTWGFRGFVVSDANSVGDLVTHGFARDKQDAAFRALTAGVNMDMVSRSYLTHLGELVESGRIPVSTIDEAVRPILEAKIRLGLFEKPYADESRVQRILTAPAHAELARIAAERSAVLLRNEGGLLPLARDRYKSIAVIGPLADSEKDMLSFWAPRGPVREVTTVYKALRAKLGATERVEFAQGVEIRKLIPSFLDAFLGGPPPPAWSEAQAKQEFDKAVELARRSDLTVLVLGELAFMSGELASKSTLDLPGKQQQLMETVAALGKPVVLVLINSRPLNINWAVSHVPAILEAWHPGVQGGTAVANLLDGDAVPGGKLPITWPRSEGQVPIYHARNLTHQPETAPGFKSRYWDILSSPLYPFGYGLSYTSFQYSELRLDSASARVGGTVKVSVTVRNTGSRRGDEVVQVYIHQRAGSASRPIRELKGFERVALAPGEQKVVSFPLGKDELSYWSSQERKWVEEPESFDVWVGGDSTATLHTTLQLTP